MKLCDRPSVMKNGLLFGTVNVGEMTDDDLLGIIIVGKLPFKKRLKPRAEYSQCCCGNWMDFTTCAFLLCVAASQVLAAENLKWHDGAVVGFSRARVGGALHA
jgi:hypothetical protein